VLKFSASLFFLASVSAVPGPVTTQGKGEPAGTLDLWPSQVRPLPDGSVEYRYRLAGLAASPVASEMLREFGEDQVEAFLGRLPDAVTVKLQPGGSKLLLDVGEVEHAPLIGSFTALSSQRRHAIADLDMLLWKARQFEDGAIATLELAAEDGTLGLPLPRPAFWSRILDSSLRRYLASSGDEKEGALLLIKRIAAAQRLISAPLRTALRAESQLMAEIESEVRRLQAFEPELSAVGPFRWNKRLRCVYVRDWVLAQPLPMTRAGLAAALFLMDTIEGDPKLSRTHAGLERLRDSLRGFPSKLTGQSEVGPALFASGENPISRFLATFEKHEQAQGWEELSLAAQEGRIMLTADAGAPFESWRESTFVALLNPMDAATSGLSFGPSYQSRLVGLFQAVHGADWQSAPQAGWSGEAQTPPPALKVRLRITPQLSLEPSAGAFGRVARAHGRLAEVLSSFDGAGRLQRVLPDGRRMPEPLQREVDGMEILFHGFELLSAEPDSERQTLDARDEKALAAARRYLRNWRMDADLREDVRSLQPHQTGKSDAVHAGIFGIGWRSLQVQFAEPGSPTLTDVALEDLSLFELDARATATYSIPSLVTGAVVAPANASLDRRAFRALCDKAKGDPVAIEAALLDTLSGRLRISQRGPLEQLGRNPLHHPREGDGFTHVMQAAQPSHGAFHP